MANKTCRIGVALAGGGPQGAIYEIGALRALDEAIEGIDFNRVTAFVGVSAGAFIAASLANNLTTDQMVRAIMKTDPGEHPFEPSLFLTPAIGHFIRAGLNLPAFVADAINDYVANSRDRSVFKSLTRLGRALPIALFDNKPIRTYLQRIYSRPGRTDDFNQLGKKLYIVAADLDSGESVIFGKDHWRHIPISQAVQASCALPGLYPPVEFEGRHYVDGVLLKTLHTSVILEEGLDLTICINPIVPVDTRRSVDEGFMRRGKLIDRGMPTILSQTFRTLIHSRMELGFATYASRFQGSDLLLFEPHKEDYRMFFTNIFSFSSRKAVCEHAYHSTLAQLAARRTEIGATLQKHGLRLRDEVLDDKGRDLWHQVGLDLPRTPANVTDRLAEALDRLETALAQ